MTKLGPPYSLPGPSLLNNIVMGSRVGHGSTVVEGAINSRNFVSGSTGWQLTAAGNLEANSGVFRGDITGASGTFSGTISAATITGSTITGGSISGTTIDGGTITAGTINASSIVANDISQTQLGANSVGTSEIQALAVTASEISNSTITAAKIVSGTLTSASGVFGAISANDITTGTLSAITVVADNDFKTGTSGTRVEILDSDNGKIRFYGSSTNYSQVSTSNDNNGVLSLISNVTGAATPTALFPQISLEPSLNQISLTTDTGGEVVVSGDFYVSNADEVEIDDVGTHIYLHTTSGTTLSPGTGDIAISANDDILMSADDAISLQIAGSQKFAVSNQSGAGFVTIDSTHSTEGGQLRLNHSTSGSNEAHLDNAHVSSNDYLRFLGGTTGGTVLCTLLASTALYSNNTTGGRDVEVTSGGTLYSLSSSVLLKRDIRFLEKNLITRSRNVSGRIFKLTEEARVDDSQNLDEDDIGFIAEEMAEHVPELVEYDASGAPQGVKYKKATVVLWEWCKDISRRLEEAGIP